MKKNKNISVNTPKNNEEKSLKITKSKPISPENKKETSLKITKSKPISPKPSKDSGQ